MNPIRNQRNLRRRLPCMNRAGGYFTRALALSGAALIAAASHCHLSESNANAVPPAEPIVPPPPPEVTARTRLAAIDAMAMWNAGQVKGLYLLVSEIMREYAGGRYQFDALERTTGEDW